MDEGRLKAVRRCQKMHRRFAYAMNDTIRNRQKLYESCLSREEQEASSGLMTDVVRMRKAMVRSKVLVQCLRGHRQDPPDRARSEPILGKYGGRPIESFSRDIDQRLAWFHPRLRRLRKVNRIKQTCLRQGAILDEETVKERMEDFFARNLPRASPEARLSPVNVKTKRAPDDDDDDWDFPDLLGGAKIKLKLHPFGNAVDLNVGPRTRDSPQHNVFRGKSVSPTKGLFGSGKPYSAIEAKNEPLPAINGYKSPVKGPSLSKHEPIQSKTNYEKHGQDITVSSSKGNHSPRLSKYSQPLPAIPVTSSNTETSHRETLENVTRTDIRGKESAHGNTPVVSKQDAEADLPEKPALTRRKTLILPPIETSKDMVKRD